jgi:ABC-type multidrug transport system permease subunit
MEIKVEKDKDKDKEHKSLSLSEIEKNIIEADSSYTKLTYIVLIYIFYIFGGLFNEKLTKSTYEYTDKDNNVKTFKFKYTLIILCSLSSFSFVISSYMSQKMKYKLFKDLNISPVSFYDKSIIGILHTISTFTSQLSLLYILISLLKP